MMKAFYTTELYLSTNFLCAGSNCASTPVPRGSGILLCGLRAPQSHILPYRLTHTPWDWSFDVGGQWAESWPWAKLTSYILSIRELLNHEYGNAAKAAVRGSGILPLLHRCRMIFWKKHDQVAVYKCCLPFVALEPKGVVLGGEFFSCSRPVRISPHSSSGSTRPPWTALQIVLVKISRALSSCGLCCALCTGLTELGGMLPFSLQV